MVDNKKDDNDVEISLTNPIKYKKRKALIHDLNQEELEEELREFLDNGCKSTRDRE